MTRFITKELVQCLLYADSQGVIHPSLYLTSILLGSGTSIALCGWSNFASINKEPTMSNCLQSLGNLVIHMLTKRGATG